MRQLAIVGQWLFSGAYGRLRAHAERLRFEEQAVMRDAQWSQQQLIADQFERASVVFTDMKGFTKFTSTVAAPSHTMYA